MFGSITHRFSDYRKSAFLDGEWFEAPCWKTTQSARMPGGWRMTSMARVHV